MDNPIFKLEKVVQAKGSEPLEDFEGPLDLILFLLSKNKIEIQDIPIALILDQYQEYLEQRKQMDLEVASEFVAMAAHLMYIKTRMLLNLEDEEAQSEMDALIKSLEERLRTRFEWGLTADIQPPDFETRVAIVKRKAELLNLDLPNDVAEYIANHLKQNIRQLEGAVKKLNAYYMLEGIEPCIGVTTTAIKDTLNDSQPIPVTIEKILNEVARTYNVMPSDIRGKKRNANVSAARQMTMYIIREVTGMSMEAIGQEFQRDHSTVVYSIKTMEENIKRDQHLKEMCSDIMKNVRT